MAFDDHFAGFQDAPPQPDAAEPEAEQPSPQGIDTIDWPSREGRAPPKRKFVVDDWLPTGCATSLYAPGGFGKSLLAQTLGSCAASGWQFLGLSTMHTPSLGVFCEDDDDELWRRQCRINSVLDLRMAHLGDFAAQGRLGLPNLIMAFTKGKPPAALPLLAEIENKARAIGAKLVILDNAAQLFGGEENSRAEVTTFINAINGLARRLDAAVLMLGHPPKSGAEYSGSTAWHAAVRCMWSLGRVAEENDEGEPSDRWCSLAPRRTTHPAVKRCGCAGLMAFFGAMTVTNRFQQWMRDFVGIMPRGHSWRL